MCHAHLCSEYFSYEVLSMHELVAIIQGAGVVKHSELEASWFKSLPDWAANQAEPLTYH
jgi:deoxyhypusine synthase